MQKIILRGGLRLKMVLKFDYNFSYYLVLGYKKYIVDSIHIY